MAKERFPTLKKALEHAGFDPAGKPVGVSVYEDNSDSLPGFSVAQVGPDGQAIQVDYFSGNGDMVIYDGEKSLTYRRDNRGRWVLTEEYVFNQEVGDDSATKEATTPPWEKWS